MNSPSRRTHRGTSPGIEIPGSVVGRLDGRGENGMGIVKNLGKRRPRAVVQQSSDGLWVRRHWALPPLPLEPAPHPAARTASSTPNRGGESRASCAQRREVAALGSGVLGLDKCFVRKMGPSRSAALPTSSQLGRFMSKTGYYGARIPRKLCQSAGPALIA
jgi:hypothetical protein